MNSLTAVNGAVQGAPLSGSSGRSAAAEGISSFQKLLEKALDGVNAQQQEAQREAVGVALGDSESVHRAIIASEKALLSLQLAAQVESKVVEAYNEIIRMQI